MVSSLILLVFRWYILEKAETWRTIKENCSSDATSVYSCEWNKMVLKNTITREIIIEWVINRATASLSLLNTSGSVAMHRYQWLSNTYAWHYMLAFTASHTQNAEINRTTGMTRQLVQQPKMILAELLCKSMFLVENEWQ